MHLNSSMACNIHCFIVLLSPHTWSRTIDTEGSCSSAFTFLLQTHGHFLYSQVDSMPFHINATMIIWRHDHPYILRDVLSKSFLLCETTKAKGLWLIAGEEGRHTHQPKATKQTHLFQPVKTPRLIMEEMPGQTVSQCKAKPWSGKKQDRPLPLRPSLLPWTRSHRILSNF